LRSQTFRRDLAGAGIVYKDEELGRRVDLHALRKTFGTALVLNGEQPRVVMEAMRHSDLKLTMKLYTDAGQLPVGAALGRLPWNKVRVTEKIG
jgi:integrase